jgi:predicted subunit of tRNA(5-methylaminomethyl-2-thiouridylate) methyltransferase
MNKYIVKMVIETYSDDPEEWIIDAVADKLEEDERIPTFAIERIESA